MKYETIRSNSSGKSNVRSLVYVVPLSALCGTVGRRKVEEEVDDDEPEGAGEREGEGGAGPADVGEEGATGAGAGGARAAEGGGEIGGDRSKISAPTDLNRKYARESQSQKGEKKVA